MTISSQNWDSYTGFTSAPTSGYLDYQIMDNYCHVEFWFYGFGVNALNVASSFTFELPVTAIDEGSTIFGGQVFCNFSPSLVIAANNCIVIPKSLVNQTTQSITISIPTYLNTSSSPTLMGNFDYTFGLPV